MARSSTPLSTTDRRCDGFMSSHTSIFSEPAMTIWRIFDGLSQLTVTWAMAPLDNGMVR